MTAQKEFCLVVGVLILAVALVACAISLGVDWYEAAAPQYSDGKLRTFNVQYGLWGRCVEVQGNTAMGNCMTWSEIAESHIREDMTWLTATQVMMILSLVIQFLSLLATALYGWVMKTRNIVFFIAVSFAYLGGILSTVGISVFGACHERFEGQNGLDAGFGLGTASACLAFISTFFMFVLWQSRKHVVT